MVLSRRTRKWTGEVADGEVEGKAFLSFCLNPALHCTLWDMGWASVGKALGGMACNEWSFVGMKCEGWSCAQSMTRRFQTKQTDEYDYDDNELRS